MGAVALGRTLQGGIEGLDRGMARRDRETQRERSDVQFEQGQEEREYQLTRRSIEDTRADDQYKIQKDKQDRFREGNDALRNWMTTGDIESINRYMNKFSPDELDYKLDKNPDGSYSSVMGYEGKKSDSKPVSEEEIGTHMHVLMSQNPYATLSEQQASKKGVKAKEEDRAHDMSKLEREYELKTGLEHVKGKYKAKGKTGKGGTSVPGYQKELADLSKEKYGGTFQNGMWSFDSTRKERMSATHSDLAGAYYMAGEGDTNTAHRQASRAMSELEQRAVEQADIELDEGTIDKKQYEGRVADIVDHYTDGVIKRMAPTPGDSLQRGDQTAPKSDTGTDIPLEAIQQLKTDPTDEMKKFFDDTFGPGAADNILSGGQMAEDTGGVKSGKPATGALNLIRDASAGEAQTTTSAAAEEEPKLTRQQRRKEGVKSQKAHKKIAVSEYKNEWVNMDDNEKVEWWTDNSSALKAASPRSHKKANKEIIAIRNKSKIGRPGRASK